MSTFNKSECSPSERPIARKIKQGMVEDDRFPPVPWLSKILAAYFLLFYRSCYVFAIFTRQTSEDEDVDQEIVIW